MAVAISESSSSTGTTTFPSPTTSIPLFLPGHRRRAESSNLFGDQFGEQPTFQQLRLNKLVAEAFHGESSTELRNEQLGVAAVRALVNFGINQARMESRHDSKTVMDVDVDSEEKLPSAEEKEEWESIQDYGKYLGKTADTFQYTVMEAPLRPTSPINIPQKQRTTENLFSLFEWFSWRNFRFNTEFAQLAPLTTRENRIHAQQSAKLTDWILDWGNDVFFGWQSLGQVVGPPPHSEETRRHREMTEQQALHQILEVVVDPTSTPRPAGIRPALEGIPERAQSSFARYLSQEAPQSRGPHRLGGSEPSRSSSMAGSDEDTRSVVSQDNHWRRTIFG